jgi:hypothetical protein
MQIYRKISELIIGKKISSLDATIENASVIRIGANVAIFF